MSLNNHCDANQSLVSAVFELKVTAIKIVFTHAAH